MAFFNLQFTPFMLHSFLRGHCFKNLTGMAFSGKSEECYTCRRFPLFRNLQSAKQLGVMLGCDPENILQTIVLLHSFDTFCFKIVFNKEGFLAYS